jgi:hypothetical protein
MLNKNKIEQGMEHGMAEVQSAAIYVPSDGGADYKAIRTQQAFFKVVYMCACPTCPSHLRVHPIRLMSVY